MYEPEDIDRDFLKALLKYGRRNPGFACGVGSSNLVVLDEGDVDDIIEGLKLLRDKRNEGTK